MCRCAGTGIKPSASCCSRKRCGSERCREVRITELNASKPFDEVTLILVQVMSKSVSDSSGDKQCNNLSMALWHAA